LSSVQGYCQCDSIASTINCIQIQNKDTLRWTKWTRRIEVEESLVEEKTEVMTTEDVCVYLQRDEDAGIEDLVSVTIEPQDVRDYGS
jgi:hypothetical protein